MTDRARKYEEILNCLEAAEQIPGTQFSVPFYTYASKKLLLNGIPMMKETFSNVSDVNNVIDELENFVNGTLKAGNDDSFDSMMHLARPLLKMAIIFEQQEC